MCDSKGTWRLGLRPTLPLGAAPEASLATERAARPSDAAANLRSVELHGGHVEGLRVVHLTQRSFVNEAFCGELVVCDGEPDLAVICGDCHALAIEAGGDPASWVVELPVVELRAAA